LRLVDIGEIKAGRRADIVILDENPLENIENLIKISFIILKGEVIMRDMLIEKYQNPVLNEKTLN